jgi:pimeloyl-ACP methyl ester carboxylesterase
MQEPQTMIKDPKGFRQSFRYEDSVVLNYEVHGHGPTSVVFLHGFAAGLVTWEDIRPLFPVDLFRLYLLDLKGFGISSKPSNSGYAPEEQAGIVISFMKAKMLHQAVLIGHSLGGGIALLALRQAEAEGARDLISRLILIDCAAYPQRLPRIFRWLRTPILGWAILHFLPVRFIVFYTLTHIYHDKRSVTPERIDRYVTCFGREGIDHVFILTCRSLIPGRYESMSDFYHNIAIPTLIIWGGEDRIISSLNGERLQSEIPGSSLVIIANCGHNPHEERPAETYAAIAEFLEFKKNRELH